MINIEQTTDTNCSQVIDDEVLLRLVASALFDVARRAEAGIHLRAPYPPVLQRALDRLATVFLQRGHLPPQSVSDLFALCRQPLADWPISLPEGAVGSADTLLLGDRITSLCDEWAEKEVGDVEGELFEQTLIDDVRRICRNLDRQDAYVAFRRHLIEAPVLSEFELRRACIRPALSPLEEQLTASYQPVPRCHQDEGQYRCCIRCQSLLLRTKRDGFVCENEQCRVNGDFVTGRRLASEDSIVWLRRELRRYIMRPGLAELQLYHRLDEFEDLHVELWPAFDNYDLLVRFPNQDVWAIDVKDQKNPFLLAASTKRLPDNPQWDRAYFVFPDTRRRERPDYLRAFNNYSGIVSGMVDACFTSELVKRIETHLRSKTHA